MVVRAHASGLTPYQNQLDGPLPLLYGKQVALARADGQAWPHAALTGQGNLATVVSVSASLEGATTADSPSHDGPQVEASDIILEPRRCHLYLHASRLRYHCADT